MHHQHSLSPALEKLCVWDSAADLRAVAVAVYSFERLEIRNLQQGLLVPEVPRVPYLVHRLEELFQRVVEPAVCVRNDSDVHSGANIQKKGKPCLSRCNNK